MTSKIIFSTALIMLFFGAIAGPGAPPTTPIDGGLSVLLAAGGLYGVKKLRDISRKH